MSEKKLDILNREDFINRVIQLVNLISSNKGNMTFAINGAWGCGKTFVLEEIERRLSEDESKKYLVIHYNCWQYDYYDEPLVALVATILDCLEEQTRLIPNDTKDQALVAVKNTLIGLLSVGSKLIEAKFGFNPKELYDTLASSSNEMKQTVKENHEYDGYFGFKSALTELQDLLRHLTDHYTVVFTVDELDRCLPEYTIKVLERLHHITDGMKNTITIVSVDKDKLRNTITTIFGGNAYGNKKADIDKTVDGYLKKFIHFELALDNGKPDAPKFFEKYPDFLNRFDPALCATLKNTDRFIKELFGGIDPRSQERIVEKATIFNDVCFGDEKQDYTMMYMELFMATLYYHYNDDSIFSDKKRITDPLNVFESYDNIPSALKTQNSGFCFNKAIIHRDSPGEIMLVEQDNVFMIVFYYWYHAKQKYRSFVGEHEFMPWLASANQRIDENLRKLSETVNTLRIIA